jgi:hypothetical protein
VALKAVSPRLCRGFSGHPLTTVTPSPAQPAPVRTCKSTGICRRKKKLPQAGQEPVEAVESRHISPDGAHLNRSWAGTQRYSAKIFPHFSGTWMDWGISRHFIHRMSCRLDWNDRPDNGLRHSAPRQNPTFGTSFAMPLAAPVKMRRRLRWNWTAGPPNAIDSGFWICQFPTRHVLCRRVRQGVYFPTSAPAAIGDTPRQPRPDALP